VVEGCAVDFDRVSGECAVQADTARKAATKESGSLGRPYQAGTRFLWYKRRMVLIRGFVDLRNRWLFATTVGTKTKTL